ncbi:hypothetical protein [Anaerofustis sp.]|uniref:hypothetical protein n=1 Tax=Anaerofustis sp. TaxID=1872517 RepID=UPI0025C725D1|nr:hypothetical protein [Anaerofustis sp.]
MALKGVIKEYLVSLGFNVNKNSLSDALDTVNFGTDKMVSMVSKMTSSLAKGTVGIITLVSSAVVAVGKLIVSVADADMQMQNAANSMWMNVDAYRVTEDAVTSLGYSMNELSTIARNPELTARFKELVSLGQQTSAPKELDSMLKKVRDVTFEFDKMKVIAKNGVRQIVYYFMKYLGVDIDEIRAKLSNFNKFLQENLPKISAVIAKVLYYIYRIGKAIAYVVSLGAKLISGAYNFMKKFPATFKVFIGVIGAILLTINPILTIILAGLSAIVLLIDDYMTWKRGGKSLFGDKWQGVEGFLNKAKGVLEWIFEQIEWAVNYIINNLKPFFSWLYDIFSDMFGWLKDIFDWFDEKVFPYVKKGTDFLGLTDSEDPEGVSLAALGKEAITGRDPLSSSLGFVKTLKNMFFDGSSAENMRVRALLGDKEAARQLNVSYEQNVNVKGSVDDNALREINKYTKRALEAMNISSVVR